MRLPHLNPHKFILLFSFLVLSNTLFGKAGLFGAEFNQGIITDSVYAVVEKEPEFPGGEAARIEYTKQNIIYPSDARQKHVEGKVNVQFIVSSIGQVVDAKVVKKLAPGFDEEALRVVNSFPKWIPGEQNGKKVPTYRVIQVTFKYAPVPNSEESWQLSDSTLIVIDSLKMPLKFNLEVINMERIDTGFILKPFPEETKDKLIKQYGLDARNGVLLLKTYDVKNLNAIMANVEDGDENYIFNETDKMPQFPGGETKLLDFVAKNMRYPVLAQEFNIQGCVTVQFVVDRTGNVINAKVVRSVNPLLDAEALRVVNLLQGWTPGEKNGKKVAVYYTLPLKFRLEGEGFTDQSVKVWERNAKTIIMLDGAKLPSMFDLNLLNYRNLASYKTLKPTTKHDTNHLVELYGEDAVNGVILMKSSIDNPLSRVTTNERTIAERTDSIGRPIYDVIEKMPVYPGGERELLKFVSSNLNYPSIAQTQKIQGTVIVRFVVNSLGNTEKVEVLRGLSQECDKEALRVISLLKNWIPGEQNGAKVSVYYTLPIRFKLTK